MSNNQAITAQVYVAKGGSICPNCGSSDINGGPVEVDASTAWQEITCQDCSASWNDLYQLTGYADLKRD